jgi:N-acetylated-alpha-linked acidic dipeptidase
MNPFQYLSLLAYNIADADVIPFNLTNYAIQMDSYYTDLLAAISTASATLDTSALRTALDGFAQAAQHVDARKQQAIATGDPELVARVNQQLRDFQRGFVSQGGLPNREFYKHLIFAPGIDTGEWHHVVIVLFKSRGSFV